MVVRLGSLFLMLLASCYSLFTIRYSLMGSTDYMARALSLAQRAKGSTGNNPAVGAVIVRDGRIVGEGFTQPPGQAHAEVIALRQADELARGATLYVTLEPCCHYGRTPPCADSVVASGIAEVHMALLDPNPLVSGGGKATLERAGIATFVGEHEADARRAMEAWLTYISSGRPQVIAKYAMSLDGKIATSTGESRWISGPLARQEVHRLRSEVDAIMVGANTAIIDDPQLTARDESGNPLPRQPLRVLLDSTARIPPSRRIVAGSLPGTTLVVVGPRAEQDRLRRLREQGNVVAVVPERQGRVDLDAALRNLAAEWESTSLLVEGGGTLLGALFDQDLVDKVVAFIAPKLIGGAGAPGPVGGQGAASMRSATRLRDVSWQRLGEDVMITGYVERGCSRE